MTASWKDTDPFIRRVRAAVRAADEARARGLHRIDDSLQLPGGAQGGGPVFGPVQWQNLLGEFGVRAELRRTGRDENARDDHDECWTELLGLHTAWALVRWGPVREWFDVVPHEADRWDFARDFLAPRMVFATSPQGREMHATLMALHPVGGADDPVETWWALVEQHTPSLSGDVRSL